jgi:hypothetical protein
VFACGFAHFFFVYCVFCILGIIEALRLLFGDTGCMCYGDSIYYRSRVITRCHRDAHLTPEQKTDNSSMNKARTSVEHGFGEILFRLFPYLNCKRNFRIFRSSTPLGIIYKVGILFTNFKACFRGNQVSTYFGVSPPMFKDYINV